MRSSLAISFTEGRRASDVSGITLYPSSDDDDKVLGTEFGGRLVVVVVVVTEACAALSWGGSDAIAADDVRMLRKRDRRFVSCGVFQAATDESEDDNSRKTRDAPGDCSILNKSSISVVKR